MTLTGDVLLLDTSALAKRYVAPERHADRIRALCETTEMFVAFSRLAQTELASALARRERARELLPEQVRQIWTLYSEHVRTEYQVVALTEQILLGAEALLLRQPLRAGDALHVATALLLVESGAVVRFVTADRRQADAATAEGLKVIFAGD